MHYVSTLNPEKVFYTLDELKAAQEAAKASGDLKQMNEVFDLTWVDSTSTDNLQAQ